ncbi:MULTISPECIES: hypothetical protein, partial [Rhizobium]
CVCTAWHSDQADCDPVCLSPNRSETIHAPKPLQAGPGRGQDMATIERTKSVAETHRKCQVPDGIEIIETKPQSAA